MEVQVVTVETAVWVETEVLLMMMVTALVASEVMVETLMVAAVDLALMAA
jgi:hypothetical protein